MADSRNNPSIDPVGQAVRACLSHFLAAGEDVVVGFSGGLDSTVLLHAAAAMAEDSGMPVSALHVHHGLSANAGRWADFCAEFCRNLKVPLVIRPVEVSRKTGDGLEGAARRARYDAFAGHPARWVLLAHHADDQAETLLYNLVRGAGVRGAAAIPESRGRILRPLLRLTRRELRVYAVRHDLAWCEDESNADRRHARNYLRHEVMPRLARRFPHAGTNLAAAAGRFAEASALLDDLARLDLGDVAPEFPLPLTPLRHLADARSRNLLRALLSWHGAQPPDERRLSEFVRQIRTAAPDRHPRLDTGRYSLWCKAGRLHFRIEP